MTSQSNDEVTSRSNDEANDRPTGRPVAHHEPSDPRRPDTDHESLVARIRAAPPRLGPVRLVAVDGPSGAGKSTFAGKLAEKGAFSLVHLDDFLDGWGDLPTVWTRVEAQLLAPLRRGKSGRYQKYDWLAGRFGAEWFEVAPDRPVVLEGVSAARAVIRPELVLSVYLDAPRDLRLARTIARDGAGLTTALEAWMAAEDVHFARDGTRRAADLVLRSES